MSRKGKPATHHGYLVIDKPAGWTSHDVVARVRRIVVEKKVGHAGTLDPAATGVLPVAIGNATRTIEYLAEADKTYIADVTFGVTTDSCDIEGRVTGVNDASHLDLALVEPAIHAFVGDQLQVPPMHSAIKVDGRPMYELARKGEVVDLPARSVTINSIAILGWNAPTVRIEVTCSKGTYIRSLARDIGERVGPGAYLSRLVRTRVGSFRLQDAMTLDRLAERMEAESWEQVALAPDCAMLGYDAIVLNEGEAADWHMGRRVPSYGATGTVRVYDATGMWIGVGQIDDGSRDLRPIKVVHDVVQDSESA
jgi:tRNA pseudouridine55 synthase